MAVKPLASQREAAIAAVRAHYVHNTIDVDEYEKRVEHITLADDLDALNLAVADLQPLAVVAPSPQANAIVLADESRTPLLSIFGSLERRGGWLTARQQRLVTVFGNAELGLLDTPLPDGVTTIDIRCVFGNVELTLPADLRVDMQVTGILGNVGDAGRARAHADVGSGPVLRLRGVCVFGNIEIHRR